jgi:hypothetical protein
MATIKKNKYVVGLLLLTLSACAKPISNSIGEQVSGEIGCESFKDDFYDSLYKAVENGTPLPDPAVFAADLKVNLSQKLSVNSFSEKQTAVLSAYQKIYSVLLPSGVKSFSVEANAADSKAALLERLTSLELGDRTTPEKAAAQDILQEQFAVLKANRGDISVSCSNITPTPPPQEDKGTYFDTLKKQVPIGTYGAWKALATAYQSCNTLALDPMTRTSPIVSGITITGRHSSGRGYIREVSSVSKVDSSHYYLRNSSIVNSTCFNVKASPLIYDFGGKPAASSAQNSELDFFRNGGTGSSALGMDCSGLVFSSLASSGRKLKKDGRLKAISVFGVNAAMMSKPTANGLDCLKPVTFSASTSVVPGDILANSGHVVMVDSIGNDPLGLARAANSSQCTTAKLSSSGFNFTIVQSSPSNGGIGINRYFVADYLPTNSSMKAALEAYAVYACKVHYGVAASAPVTSNGTLVRHTGEAACMDTEVVLSHQSCLDSCAI